jgi:23S rRNA (cytosine1962-C5)-methyltransferase
MTTTPPRTYSLLDFGHGKRLEQWGPYRLIRPDPTARDAVARSAFWRDADAVYQGEKGQGIWRTPAPLPATWPVEFDDVRLAVKLAPYKHTGVFPEQQANWRWMRETARTAGRPLNVLNLFAYSGGATVSLANDGHRVTHVDASRPAIGWGKENAALNDLPGDRVRWMLEDAPAFAAREVRRGKTYDGILLDPPAFGHSPSGKSWRVDRDLAPLLESCAALLSPDPAFIVLNGYAQNDTPESFHRLLTGVIRGRTSLTKFDIDARELGLATPDGRELSTGIVARCAFR